MESGKDFRFECRMCGECCRIKDGIVRVSEAEIARIAKFLGMTDGEFIEKETELAPDRRTLMLHSRPDGSCVFLTGDNLCRINAVKPDKCGTFPYDWVNPDSFSVCPELRALKGRGASQGIRLCSIEDKPARRQANGKVSET